MTSINHHYHSCFHHDNLTLQLGYDEQQEKSVATYHPLLSTVVPELVRAYALIDRSVEPIAEYVPLSTTCHLLI